MKYKINFKNQFKAMSSLIYVGLALTVALPFFYYRGTDPMLLNCVLLSFAVIYFLPAIFLQAEYILINNGKVLEIDTLAKRISFNNEKSMPFDEIDIITIYMSPVLYRNGSDRYTSFDSYQYAVIKLKSGYQFIFTFLMAYDVQAVMDKIEGVPIERKRTFFPTTLALD